MQKIHILPIELEQITAEQELGITHSSFNEEYILFCCIQAGSVDFLRKGIKEYFSHEMVMGRMSGNNLRQIQYWAVSTIAVAVHYAILGGLDETDAFNMSDYAIRAVDNCTEEEDIFSLIKEKAIVLCKMVAAAKYNRAKSTLVRKCLHYIHNHLSLQITLDDLSKICGASSGYISKQFKKEMNCNLHDYIMKEKIEASLILLKLGYSYADICYKLGFCSESHFITCFKKITGKTPGKTELYEKNNK